MSIPNTVEWGKTGSSLHNSLFYEGRNGMAIMTGVEILRGTIVRARGEDENVDYVMLFPLSTKGTGRATMTIPISHLDEFIDKLTRIRQEYKRTEK